MRICRSTLLIRIWIWLKVGSTLCWDRPWVTHQNGHTLLMITNMLYYITNLFREFTLVLPTTCINVCESIHGLEFWRCGNSPRITMNRKNKIWCNWSALLTSMFLLQERKKKNQCTNIINFHEWRSKKLCCPEAKCIKNDEWKILMQVANQQFTNWKQGQREVPMQTSNISGLTGVRYYV